MAQFKLAQTGGQVVPSFPPLQDTPMDFDSFSKAGVSLGSGALLIGSEETCVVDLAKVLLNFFRFESCGKCNPCRIGNQACYRDPEKYCRRHWYAARLEDLQDDE